MSKPISETRILFVADSNGSGPVYRALAVYKAAIRAGIRPQNFSMIVASPYSWLLDNWLAGQSCRRLLLPVVVNTAVFLTNHLENAELTGELPDILIANYFNPDHQTALKQFPGVAAWVIQRDAVGFEGHYRDFDSSVWQAVIAIEPGVKEALEKTGYPMYIREVAPVIAVRPDELLPREAARKELYRLHHYETHLVADRHLCLVAHNGIGDQEMAEIGRQSRSLNPGPGYDYLYFSQRGKTPGIIYHKPLAQLYQGIDALVAAPGYNTFWEWTLLARSEALENVKWLPQYRTWEDQAGRVNRITSEEIDRLRSLPNGADMLIKMVTGIGVTAAK